MRRMIDPVEGLPAKTDFIPSVKMVKEFIEDRMPRRAVVPEHKLLPPAQIEQVSQEERERRVRMLKNTAQVIRDTVKAKCVGRPKQWQQKQHSLVELFDISKSDVHT